MNNNTEYEQTLNKLELRRANLQEELSKIEEAIDALQALVHMKPVTETVAVHIDPSQDRLKFSGMSVRRAILQFLTDSVRPVHSSYISGRLIDGGNEKATKPNVSAVLSEMKKRGEVESVSGEFKLTEKGKHIAKHFTLYSPNEP